MLDLLYLIRYGVDGKKLKKRLRFSGPFRMAEINRQALRENNTSIRIKSPFTDEMYDALAVFYNESSGLFGNALPFCDVMAHTVGQLAFGR